MKIDSSLAAVVTGGASGLGLATVTALRAAGARVAIFDLNPETGEQAAAQTGAVFCRCDVLSDESVDEAFARARAAQGQERVLVCCAGGGNAIPTARRDRETGEIRIFPSDRFEWVLQLNTVGTFRCITRAAAGMMTLDPIDGERGAVVNTASAAATEGQMGQAAYSAAKAGVLALTRVAAAENGRHNVRVNAVTPGLIYNEFLRKIYPDEFFDGYAENRSLVGRVGRPEDVAAVVAFLVSEGAGYVTGETYGVSGGVFPHA